MKLDSSGKTTLAAEVTQIDKHGIWLLMGGNESFLPFERFPAFREASVGAIHNVELLTNGVLHWADLDIDIPVGSLENATQIPSAIDER